MRKLIIGGLCFVLAGASTAFAVNHSMRIGGTASHITDTGCEVITLAELTKEMVEDFFTGKAPQVILECMQGSNLPFNLSLKGEFLALEAEDNPGALKVLKTCFIKSVGDTFFFSSDLHNWKDFQEFFTGAIEVTLNADEGTPIIGFNIDINQRP